jgi:hypothetical protein
MALHPAAPKKLRWKRCRCWAPLLQEAVVVVVTQVREAESEAFPHDARQLTPKQSSGDKRDMEGEKGQRERGMEEETYK